MDDVAGVALTVSKPYLPDTFILRPEGSVLIFAPISFAVVKMPATDARKKADQNLHAASGANSDDKSSKQESKHESSAA